MSLLSSKPITWTSEHLVNIFISLIHTAYSDQAVLHKQVQTEELEMLFLNVGIITS